MRVTTAVLLVTLGSCGSGDTAGDNSKPKTPGDQGALTLPRVYPPVRSSTPTALIGDPTYASTTSVLPRAQMGMGGMGGGGMPPTLAMIVRERLYQPSPTELLRILHELDDRVAQLDPKPSVHPCLTSTPMARSYALPGGQSFEVKLQCLDRFADGSGWLALGFASALAAPPDGGAEDAGAPDGGALGAEGGGNDFYLVTGQATGNGGAYHIDRRTGDVEGWVAVADSAMPANSQVLMHFLTDRAAMTFELTFGGSGVGFCGAHLQTGHDFLYIDARPLAPPPPGTMVETCDSPHLGCFDTRALDRDLGSGDPGCAGITAFRIPIGLDGGSGGNLAPPSLSTLFNRPPEGLPAF